MLGTFECLFLFFVYICAGRGFGYPIYRDVVMDILIENVSKIKKLGYSNGELLEKSIRPKWFRSILRIISILIWPILFILCLVFCISEILIKEKICLFMGIYLVKILLSYHSNIFNEQNSKYLFY